jgi:acetoin:2,6-dichlorophenolindophenol oxidoreductase subunit alpha
MKTEHSNREQALTALRRMKMIRAFEERVQKLIDRGDVIGVMHSSIGQEATCVGACMALREDDYITGTHRSHGHPIAKGSQVDRLIAELMGRSTGICKGMGGSMHLADFSVGSLGETAIVGSSIGIAVGAALANRLCSIDRVSLAFFGDGAANTGICHEGMNMAAVWRLPVVFLCENNGYAITTPYSQSTPVKQISERARSYGFPGIAVDGQDVRAVRDAVSEAVTRARRGEGPTLVEALTYRYGDHSYRLGALSGKRDPEEVAYWRRRDPILIETERLLHEGLLADDDIAALDASVFAELDAAVEFGCAGPYPTRDDLWVNMYEDSSAWEAMPWRD